MMTLASKDNDERYVCMPLYKNVPLLKAPMGWKLTVCPECKKECWMSYAALKEWFFSGVKLLCTECALKRAINTSQEMSVLRG